MTTAATAAVFTAETRAQTGPKKPRVPTGRDPGGIAVALIGAGVDYRAADIAARLARDGEGEAIAWDIIDDDERPLEAAPAAGRRVPPFAGTETARLMLGEARTARLVPVRVPADNPMSFGAALAFVSRTPVRVVGLLASAEAGEAWNLFIEVARRSPHLLIVVPGSAVRTKTGGAILENVLAVAPCDATGRVVASATAAPTSVDVAVPVDAPAGHVLPPEALATMATARLVAMAARVLTVSPDLDGARLKAAILKAARPSVDPAGSPAPPKWLPDIATIERVE